MKEIRSLRVVAPFVAESCTDGDWTKTDVLTASRIVGKREKVAVVEHPDSYEFAVMDAGGIRERFRNVPKLNVELVFYAEKRRFPAKRNPQRVFGTCNEHGSDDCLWCFGG